MAQPELAAFDSAGSQQFARAKSAVSWPAIIAGAFVAVSTSLILVAVGTGVGFASISPWAQHGVSATTFTVAGVIWLIVTQWLSACAGGYIAGRLRTRWHGTHTHEVFFRDTAHGLITWSVATMLIASIFGSALFSAAGAGARAASDVVAGGAKGALMSPMSLSEPYEIDRLFRALGAQNAQAGQDPRPEAARILANAAIAGRISDADRAYMIQFVAARTGISQAEAQKRVDDVLASMTDAEVKARAAADAARKGAAELSIYLALSLLVGAFIASVSAALGGRLRDQHP
jgi:hypothetical protein